MKKARSLKKPRKCPVFPLRSVTVVVVDDSTKNAAAAHQIMTFEARLRDWNRLIKPLMWACCIEEFNVFTHHPLQVRLIDDQQLSLSRHSSRADRIHRSIKALAFGACQELILVVGYQLTPTR